MTPASRIAREQAEARLAQAELALGDLDLVVTRCGRIRGHLAEQAASKLLEAHKLLDEARAQILRDCPELLEIPW